MLLQIQLHSSRTFCFSLKLLILKKILMRDCTAYQPKMYNFFQENDIVNLLPKVFLYCLDERKI